MQNKNNIIIITGIIAAGICWQLQRHMAEVKANEPVSVLTARLNLPARIIISEDLINVRQVPRKDLRKDAIEIRAISDIKDISGRVTGAAVAQGVQLASGDLADPKVTAEVYNDQGAAYAQAGRYDKAIVLLSKAIEIAPGGVLAYYNLGNIYGKTKRYDKAIEVYSKAIGADPKLPQPYFTRASAYYEKGDMEKAIQDCSKAIEIYPGYAKAYYVRGEAYRRKGEAAKAAADEKTFKALSKNNGSKK